MPLKAGDDVLEAGENELSDKTKESSCLCLPFLIEFIVFLFFDLIEPTDRFSLVNGTGESSTNRGVAALVDLLSMLYHGSYALLAYQQAFEICSREH